MSKIEYLIRRYAGEYSKWYHASHWEVEIMGIDVWYYYDRLSRKGLLRENLLDIKVAVERSEDTSIRSGSEVDCEIKKLVAIIRLGKKGKRNGQD